MRPTMAAVLKNDKGICHARILAVFLRLRQWAVTIARGIETPWMEFDMKAIIFAVCAVSLTLVLCGCGPDLRTIGISEYQQGHHEAATGYFQRVLAKEPSDALSLYYMGRIYQTQGKPVQAYMHYQAAIDADPGFGYADSTRRYMKEIEQELGPDMIKVLKTTPKLVDRPVP